jgi:hypothetical protein
MLIAFVPPWLSPLFSSFNKQFVYCPPGTKCILFWGEQSGVVGPREYASQHTQWPLRTCSHSQKISAQLQHTKIIYKKKKKKSYLTNGRPFHTEAKVQASLHIHSSHQVHSAPSRTKYIGSRGNKQADGGQKQASWMVKEQGQPCTSAQSPSLSISQCQWALQLGLANYVYAFM